jgi:hypothetical protein
MGIDKNDKKTSRPLLFYQICEGDFAREVQVEFVKLQEMVKKHGKSASIAMKITVYPNDASMPDKFQQIDYQIAPGTIKRQSGKYFTEVTREGVIIGDGKTISDILQQELVFEELENVTPFEKAGNDE